MSQQHVDLLGDLAAALLEVPERWSVSLMLGNWGRGYEADVHLHPYPGLCEHGCAKTVGPAIREALAKCNRGETERPDWFAQAYERAET